MFDSPVLAPVACVGSALAGITTGALAFVSAVDVRSLLRLLATEDEIIVHRWFRAWWPNGRDFMLPLILSTIAVEGAAFYQSREPEHLCAAVLTSLIGFYTRIVMHASIEELRHTGTTRPANVVLSMRRFCAMHHVRLVLAMLALGCALRGLTKDSSRSALSLDRMVEYGKSLSSN